LLNDIFVKTHSEHTTPNCKGKTSEKCVCLAIHAFGKGKKAMDRALGAALELVGAISSSEGGSHLSHPSHPSHK
jgi:hypothetical protein